MQKLFVITGVSGGLGMHFLEEVLGRGFAVEGISRSTVDRVPDGAQFTQMDCTDSDSVASFWQDVRDQYSDDVDVILINNAGKFLRKSFATTEMADVEKTLADNFLTSVNMSKGFLSHFESGTIVNLNSFAGLHPRANLSVYAASKAALSSFYASLRDELSPGKIRILNLYPYRVNTWSDDNQSGTIDKDEAARWIIDMALLDGSFEITDCTIVPFEAD